MAGIPVLLGSGPPASLSPLVSAEGRMAREARTFICHLNAGSGVKTFTVATYYSKALVSGVLCGKIRTLVARVNHVAPCKLSL